MDEMIRYRRLAHAARCYLTAREGTDFWEEEHWRNQILKVLEGGTDEKQG
jgi:hypothetical protein